MISPKEGPLFNALKEHCPILFESYWPTLWGYNRHITSIFRAKFQRGVDVNYIRCCYIYCYQCALCAYMQRILSALYSIDMHYTN